MGRRSRRNAPERKDTYAMQVPVTAAVREDEDGSWSAQCLEQPSIVATGDDLDEALDNLSSALRQSFREAPPLTPLSRPIVAPLTVTFSTYDLAAICHSLGEDGRDGAEIAVKLGRIGPELHGLSKGYIDDLRRAYRGLPRTILRAWEQDDPRATTAFLFELAGLKDESEQLRRWNERSAR